MSIFSSENKNDTLIGVDLGNSTIKVVQLKKEGDTPRLVTYGITTDDEKPSIVDELMISENLINLIKQSKTTTNNAVGALPATSVFSTIIELPVMSPKEISSAIQWEVKKLVPLSIEKMSLNWHIIPSEKTTKKEETKKLRIIINAAPKDMTKQYIEIFKKSELKLVSLETEIKALQRALLTPQDKTTLIIDIGNTNTSMIVFDNNLPLLTKNVEIGGASMTNNIANSLNINFASANSTKKNIGLAMDESLDHPAAKAIKFTIDNLLIREIRYLSTILRNSNNKNINKIILTGGGAQLKNLPQYLEKQLQIKTILGDPWQKIKYPKDLKKDLDFIGANMSIAIGLALKLFEK